MKTFKKYVDWNLDEAVRWSGSLSDKLFDIGINLQGLWLPMSPSIFKRIGIEEQRATVFHVTDANGYDGIKKMQGKKQSISAFFEMQNRYFNRGIQTSGGVIFELDANILSAWREDVMSSPDKSGRRWIQLSYFAGMYRVDSEIAAIEKGLSLLVRELIKEHVPSKHADKMNLDKLPVAWQNLGLVLKRDNERKIMGQLITDYIDGVEKIMKSNIKNLQKIFRGYLNRRTTDASWDEIIVNNFIIKKVHIVDSDAWHRSSQSGDPDEDDYKGYEDFLKKVKADGFKGQFWENEMDLEIHIRTLMKSQAGK